jgi:hypothetical protein
VFVCSGDFDLIEMAAFFRHGGGSPIRGYSLVQF